MNNFFPVSVISEYTMSYRLRLRRFSLPLVWLVLISATTASTALAVEANEPLAEKEASLAEQYDRLELLAGRLAELSKSTQPRRAELLRQMVAKSREKELPEQFQTIVDSLQQDRLSEATATQKTLHSELQAMLELLLQEDRDRQIDSEAKRIKKYLAELNKLIRQQRGIKARTAGGDSQDELIDDQQRTADSAGKLGDTIAETEGSSKKSPSGAEVENPESRSSSPKGKPEEGSESSPGESSPSESSPSESSPSESSPSESSPAQSSPSSGKPSEGKPSKSSGQPSQSQGGESSDTPQDSPEEQQQSPADSAVERLKQAQQRMQQAQERLKEAQRSEAVEKQEQALRELEQAKAELEKILRQLREEEMERMLVMLEARLRKMLEAQNNIYDQTIKLEESIGRTAEHELEIASASLGRKEDQIVGEVDRALILLKEDGSSVAFPEALQQVREDMQTVASRLRSVKTDKITQAVEQDIIETLEEMLAALQQALKELREKQSSQQSGEGQPGEQPLVDQLAELRMIRALQNRVNRRTEFYDSILKGEQAMDLELLEALDKLAERQHHIFEATRDLYQGVNR
ncbi:hypothetical protein [Bythopirellula polymerisocia]|uniref:Uncharacterized protein n=1 Tax=Bythopirellula polymerisocia TaxID=2528003 RepID=A0A5C6CRX0_9BACT|nr:hypothetical protein [Bythopirellula polymerisocia]TWU27242.1 hypothetical protein Pla144_20130 [Bythopirellula polymerisocia]